MREQFERLPEIAAILETDDSYFDKSTNEYVSHYSFKTGYLNGALYAFQEQQKKIDEVLNLVCKLQYSSGERIYSEVKELLK